VITAAAAAVAATDDDDAYSFSRLITARITLSTEQ